MPMVKLVIDFECPALDWWKGGGRELWESVAEGFDISFGRLGDEVGHDEQKPSQLSSAPRRWRRVLFPTPLSPIIATISPRSTVRSRPLRTSTFRGPLLKVRVRPRQ